MKKQISFPKAKQNKEKKQLQLTIFLIVVLGFAAISCVFLGERSRRLGTELSECQEQVPKDIIMVCNNSISLIPNTSCDSMKIIKLTIPNCEFYNLDFKYINTTGNCEVIE